MNQSVENQSVENHYSDNNLLERIFAALVADGKNPLALTVDDLAPVDQFHTRGRSSTVELAELAKPQKGERVLDMGCGLAGSARFLASQFDCHVTGIDLTEDYIAAAKRLSDLVGLSEKVEVHQGDVLKLPFPDESFDLVWTEHVQMNIQDKAAFYGQVVRVLKPNGRFVFHDVFAGENSGGLRFPLPWAEEASISFLCTVEQAKSQMQSLELPVRHIVDKTSVAKSAFEKMRDKVDAGQLPPLGLHLLMGSKFREKVSNYLASVEAGAIKVAMGVGFKESPTNYVE